MDKNEHVYCTNCKNFGLAKSSEEKDDFMLTCPYENECDIYNCEDSVPYRDRPHYEPKGNI